MTLAGADLPRRPVQTSGEVLASGSSLASRRMWFLAGSGMLVVAYFAWLLSETSLGLGGISQALAAIALLTGALVLAIGLWRRARSYEVRAAGIQLIVGGPVFGDRQLIPWGSITHFGGRRTGEDHVRLMFRQQHIDAEQPLPGPALSVEEYDLLIDRLRGVLGDRYLQLELGGLAD